MPSVRLTAAEYVHFLFLSEMIIIINYSPRPLSPNARIHFSKKHGVGEDVAAAEEEERVKKKKASILI